MDLLLFTVLDLLTAEDDLLVEFVEGVLTVELLLTTPVLPRVPLELYTLLSAETPLEFIPLRLVVLYFDVAPLELLELTELRLLKLVLFA